MPSQGAPPPRIAPAAARYVPGGAPAQPVMVGPPPPGPMAPAYPQPGYAQPGYAQPSYAQPSYGYPDPYSGAMPYGMPYGGYGYDPYAGYYPPTAGYGYGYGYPSPSPYGGGLLGMFGRLLGNGPLDEELSPEEEQAIRFFYHAMRRHR